ncbi:hypothetical protein quinque_014287 [Culex quinquefasciatus]
MNLLSAEGDGTSLYRSESGGGTDDNQPRHWRYLKTLLWPTSKLLQYPMTRLFVEPVVRQGSLGTIFSIGTGSGSRLGVALYDVIPV